MAKIVQGQPCLKQLKHLSLWFHSPYKKYLIKTVRSYLYKNKKIGIIVNETTINQSSCIFITTINIKKGRTAY